jgi:opacity protein-like surface antigen
MRKIAVGLAALLAAAFAGPAMAESVQDEIQDAEQPGSEIELDIGGGNAQIHRKDGEPLFGGGEGEGGVPLESLDDPDDPIDPDPIDEELPGEGPESLSGPDDDDPLPY